MARSKGRWASFQIGSASATFSRPASVNATNLFHLSCLSATTSMRPSRSSGLSLCASAERSSTRDAANSPIGGLPALTMLTTIDRCVERSPHGPTPRRSSVTPPASLGASPSRCSARPGETSGAAASAGTVLTNVLSLRPAAVVDPRNPPRGRRSVPRLPVPCRLIMAPICPLIPMGSRHGSAFYAR